MHDLSPARHLDRHASQHGDHVAVIYEEQEWTYRRFRDRVADLAAALRADGIGPGDRVAYAGLNSLTFLTGYFAAAWVGAAFVPLNFRLAGPELRAILDRVSAALRIALSIVAAADRSHDVCRQSARSGAGRDGRKKC